MKFLIPIVLIFMYACEDVQENNQEPNLLFISSEGNFGNSDGSISVFDGENKIQVIENVGDVVQSILVHENHLFVIVNNSKNSLA